jgi:hypothetical protein
MVRCGYIHCGTKRLGVVARLGFSPTSPLKQSRRLVGRGRGDPRPFNRVVSGLSTIREWIMQSFLSVLGSHATDYCL